MTAALTITSLVFGIMGGALSVLVRLRADRMTRTELMAGFDAAALAWSVAVVFLVAALI